MKKALLIPIYEPNGRVVPFLKSFQKEDFDYFLVVNDGSNVEKYGPIFDSISKETVFTVIGYEKNRGKGFALKTGIRYLTDNITDLGCIITADGDGQHQYSDILKVRDSVDTNPNTLILGSRNFKQKGIPRNSLVGNKFSTKYMKISTGKSIKDTQTGLRAIPSELFHLALTTKGNRFEYEMNFLTDAVRNYQYKEVDIETIYHNNKNETTHFRPLVDSYRVYRSPILYIIVSILSFAIDIGLFYLFSTYVFTQDMEQRVFVSALLARISSGIFNFMMFFFVVFPNKGEFPKKAIKYLILWIINYGLSSGLTYAFKFIPTELSFIKIIVDTVLAITNYIINSTIVFVRKKIKK